MKRAAALAALVMSAQVAAQPTLDPLFSDHAVLQRGRPIAVWGTAAPSERVTVTLGSASASARAGRDGRWRVALPAMDAGGPYTLSAAGASGAGVQAQDLQIGDVWLCSGQSNMEWPVSQALNGGNEAQNAQDGLVRILTVPQRTAIAPEVSLPTEVRWQTVSPETIRDFSAACWFMVRDLRQSQDVPIGAIDASWGGTRIRPWMSEAAVRAVGDVEDAELLALHRRDPVAAARRFGEAWGRWWRERTGDSAGAEPWRDSSRLAWRPVPSISPWEQWGDPAFADFNGSVWVRRKVVLTEAEASGGATLSLGVIDDLDQTFVNGVGVGSSFGWALAREYRLPPGLLRAGENEILVNIGDSWGFGGFQGPAERLRLTLSDGTPKPLGEGWEYSVVDPSVGTPPRAPWDSHAGVATIYNGMIAPLRDFGLRGVAWYQGESDVGVPGYAGRLAAFMAAWRDQFDAPRLPFLIVSLANFGSFATTPVASGWAELREQQRLGADRDPNAALVVAMDLGERTDIHPPNKQEVGRRLARAARALAYGAAEPGSGPEILRARRSGEGVVLEFAGVTGSLRTWSGERALAFELCAEAQESCRFADATAAGTIVRIADDGRPATRVRYAWADSPVTNLYDEAPLPVGPFEVPIE
ncbi:MAG TPA: sialate O-acetylesterase [Allosphingosinicella sp.]|nr:sialate O-acetylesterase [Allosphingosinicella sp.]